MSRAGAAERGFTLIELLVVLTIGALMAAVALPRVSTLLRPDIDRTTRTRGLAIRDQRSTAMRTGCTVSVTEPHGAAAAAGRYQARGRRVRRTGCVFFPNGTSTGGRWCWRRATDGARSTSIG